MINDLLLAASEVEKSAVGTKKPRSAGVRIWTVGAAAGFTALLAFGIFWATMKNTKYPNDDVYFGEVQESSSNLFIDNKVTTINAPIPVGKSIRTSDGTAQLRLPTGIDWWMDKNTDAKILSLNAEQIQVFVQTGEVWFRVNPKRKGPAFSVETAIGRINVNGTIFAVKVLPQEVTVTLLKGSVSVSLNDGGTDSITEGYTMSLSRGEQQPIGSNEHKIISDRLIMLDWDTGFSFESSVAVKETVEELEVFDEAVSSVDVPMQKPHVKDDISTILDEIQVQRKNNNWHKVEALYKTIMRSAPGSKTAIVSHVSLGEIYLSKLHRYKDARIQFDKYIRSGYTALLPEATYGRCAALKALGDREQELKCLNDFIRRFAGTLQMQEAQARLNKLRSESHQ